MTSPFIASIVADFFYDIDKHCRNELSQETIVSERDYVSHFSCLIKNPFGVFSKDKFAHVQTLNQITEQKLGCDGIIIFKKDKEVKVGLFEAKIIKEDWDSVKTNKTTKITVSRFSSQLERQKSQINTNIIPVWEMFFNKSSIPSTHKFFHNTVSTCVKHDDAYHVKATKALNSRWTLKELESLAAISATNIQTIVYEILICNYGDLIPIDGQYCNIGLDGDVQNRINVPIYDSNILDIQKQIKAFLLEMGLKSYMFIDISKLEHHINSLNRRLIIKEILTYLDKKRHSNNPR